METRLPVMSAYGVFSALEMKVAEEPLEVGQLRDITHVALFGGTQLYTIRVSQPEAHFVVMSGHGVQTIDYACFERHDDYNGPYDETIGQFKLDLSTGVVMAQCSSVYDPELAFPLVKELDRILDGYLLGSPGMGKGILRMAGDGFYHSGDMLLRIEERFHFLGLRSESDSPAIAPGRTWFD